MALNKIVVDALLEEAKIQDKIIEDCEKLIAEQSKVRTAAMERRMAILKIVPDTPQADQSPTQAPFLTATPSQEGDVKASLVEASFGQQLKIILRADLGTPMKPKEVKEALLRSGYVESSTAKTDLQTRVTNELYRQSRLGEIKKSENGYYVGD